MALLRLRKCRLHHATIVFVAGSEQSAEFCIRRAEAPQPDTGKSWIIYSRLSSACAQSPSELYRHTFICRDALVD
jgi:hypothetical protein